MHEHRNKKIVHVSKQLSIAAILFLSISLSSFAGNPVEKIPGFRGVEHFMSTFPQATGIVCKNKGEFTEVNFTWQGMKLAAFYDLDGNQIATSREISVDNLPLTVQLNLKKEYAGFIPKEALEFDDIDNSLSYYVTVVSIKTTYLLRVSADGSSSVFKKMKN
jgi:hypothetical protein